MTAACGSSSSVTKRIQHASSVASSLPLRSGALNQSLSISVRSTQTVTESLRLHNRHIAKPRLPGSIHVSRASFNLSACFISALAALRCGFRLRCHGNPLKTTTASSFQRHPSRLCIHTQQALADDSSQGTSCALIDHLNCHSVTHALLVLRALATPLHRLRFLVPHFLDLIAFWLRPFYV